MAKESESKKAPSQREIAEGYFLSQSEFLKQLGVSSLLVTSDGVVFLGTVKGKNACMNYAKGAEVDFQEFQNPL